MYVTRSLSHYKSFPEALSLPPEGPNLGYLVIQDEDSETYSCFGLYKNKYLAGLPFPQNKRLTTRYSTGSGDHRHVSYYEVVFIPVLNQPLSANRYYALKPCGLHTGEAFTCSKKEDRTQCCFSSFDSDVKPKPLDPHDVYQQFEIVPYKISCRGDGSFTAKSVAKDGYPPYFLRRKGWEIYTKRPKNCKLREASGINNALRSRLPEFSFPTTNKTFNSVVVGKWYCPFMFIKEGRPREQVEQSIFYEMILEQKWERLFEQENEHNDKGNIVSMKAALQTEVVFVGESRREAIWDERNMVDGAVWFMCHGGDNAKEESVGLGKEIFERMRWEEEKVGWVGGGEKKIERVNREMKFEGSGVWRRFGCYVLVERFVLKRMDGSFVLAYDFFHTHQVKTIFE